MNDNNYFPKDHLRGIVARTQVIFSVFFITWIVSSCSPATMTVGIATFAANPLTATLSPSATSTETQVQSRTPTQTRTMTETRALSPTQTPTATLFPGMQSTGPFVVMTDGRESISFIDINTSTQWKVDMPKMTPYVTSMHWENEVSQIHSPDWKWYAYVTGSVDQSGTYPEGGVVLHLMNLMSGEAREIASLVLQDYYARLERLAKRSDTEYCQSHTTECLKVAVENLNASFRSIAWSPDGKYLAFGAMTDGDSADIYTYDVDTGQIRRLEKGPGNPQSLQWSPDGKWIIYEDIDIYRYYRSAWLAREGRFAVQREGTEVKKISGPHNFHSWISDYEFIAYWPIDSLSNADPNIMNIETAASFDNFHGNYESIAIDPKSRLMAVVGSTACQGGPDCQGGRKWGLYLGPLYGILDYVETPSDLKKGDHFYVGLRGGTFYPFMGSGLGMEKISGITREGKFVELPYAYDARLLISENSWLASFPSDVLRVYDPSDKLRYEFSDEQFDRFYVGLWDTNSQGIYLPSVREKALYYWRLSRPTARLVAPLPDDFTSGTLYFARLVNIKSLPHLRILPTRAVKPGEGTSIWSQTKYKELFQPGTNRYDVTIPADSSWRWSFSLGTTDPKLFEKILSSDDVEFFINGEKIDSNMFRMSDQTAEGRFSRAWATTLSGWRSGDKAELEIHYTLRSAVTDGNETYPAGEYRQIISVVVK